MRLFITKTKKRRSRRLREDDSEDEDDGERALLTPGDRPRGRERIASKQHDIGVWAQVKRIVIEVSISI